MTLDRRTALSLAFLGAFLAVGVPYWQMPYGEVTLPNAVWGPPLVLVCVLAVLSRWLSGTGLWATALVVGASVPAAVLARVVYDTAFDPTSHNLWPFELVLAAGPGLLAGILGALVGGLV